jgi:hypothetical protein
VRGCAKRCAVMQGDFALHRRHVTLDVILMHNIYNMYINIYIIHIIFNINVEYIRYKTYGMIQYVEYIM